MKFLWDKIKKSTGVIVMIAVLLIAYNTATNGHYHITESGFMLWHAHPHSDSSNSIPIQNHAHSDLEFLILQMLTNLLLATLALIVIALAIKDSFVRNLKTYQSPIIDNFRVSFKSLRAPPISFQY
ncbi:MAG: hypothetical protein CVV22_12905 [Ignavibacteriae bacterium HGW-Ignavibacteriae-1]|jgi:hypothetical protein|nr:MAG: hypothetical protein CVV22_12905 [Ignavibacteriae bacterium HGW-Ignavibacteriae-1]